MRWFVNRTLLFLALAPTPALPAWAQSDWTNPATGGTAGDWFDAANWSTAAVPDALANVQIDNGGEARATQATAPTDIAVNRIDVGKNGGIGTFMLDGISLAVSRTFKLGEVEMSFAIAEPAVNSVGTVTIQNAPLVSIGFGGGGDLDVAQTLASESGVASGTGMLSASNVDALRIESDLDIGETAGTATATGNGAVTITQSGIVDVGMNADVGESGSAAGLTSATGSLEVRLTDALEIGGDLDAGRVSSSGGDNTGNGVIVLEDLNRFETGGSVNVGLAGVSAGGRADSTGDLSIARIGSVAIGTSLGVGHVRNASMTGTANSAGSARISASGTVAVVRDVFVGRVFANGDVQSTANGTLVIEDVTAVAIGADLDVGQTGTGGTATTAGSAAGTGNATLRNVQGTIQVAAAVDVGNATAVPQTTATGHGTLVIEGAEAFSVGQDLNIGQTQGAGEAAGTGILTVSNTPAVTIGGDFDVGKTRGSAATNRGNGSATLSDSDVAIGEADGLGDLNVGNVISQASETAHATGEVVFNNSRVQVADRVNLAGASGGSNVAGNQADALLQLTRSRLSATTLDVARTIDGTEATSTAALGLAASLATFSGSASFGQGASLLLTVAGTTRADGFGAADQYAALNANTAELAGLLEVQWSDGFVAAAGDAFEVITTTGGLFGQFDSMALPELPPNLSWDVDYGALALTLSILGGEFLEADFDQDGDVDGDDFLAWQTGFGTSTGASKQQGDADGDGDVDGDDFLTWQTQFGSVASGGSAGTWQTVPEPATWGLLLTACTICCWVVRAPRAVSSSRSAI